MLHLTCYENICSPCVTILRIVAPPLDTVRCNTSWPSLALVLKLFLLLLTYDAILSSTMNSCFNKSLADKRRAGCRCKHNCKKLVNWGEHVLGMEGTASGFLPKYINNCTICLNPSSRHGGHPVAMLKTVEPTLQISAFLPCPSSNNTSGAIKYGVPFIVRFSFLAVMLACKNFDSPKSPILQRPSTEIKMFSGLMSMCTNPNVCMRFKPVATCLMTYLQSIKGQSREGSNQSNPSNPSNPSNQSNQSNPFTSIHIHHTKKKVSELSRYCKHPRKKRTKDPQEKGSDHCTTTTSTTIMQTRRTRQCFLATRGWRRPIVPTDFSNSHHCTIPFGCRNNPLPARPGSTPRRFGIGACQKGWVFCTSEVLAGTGSAPFCF